MAICSDELHFKAGSSCRSFDFSLAFHACVLCILPASLFVAASLFWLKYLGTQEQKVLKTRGSRFLWSGKMVCSGVAIASHFVALVAWITSSSDGLENALTYAMATLDLLASIALPLVSGFEHYRCLRSSLLLQGFLVLSTIFDAARIRNLVLLEINAFYLSAFCTAFALRIILLLLEQMHKTEWLKPEYTQRKLSRELTAGIFERVTVFWFVEDRTAGWRTRLRLKDLGEIDLRDAEEQYAAFMSRWDRSAGKKAPLLRTIWRFLGFSALEPLFPVVLMSLCAIASPVLLKATLRFMASWREDEPQPVSFGWGLAAAYGLIGITLTCSNAVYEMSLYRLQARIRALLSRTVYRKALRLHVSSAESIGSGALSSYESIDVERITEAIRIPYLILQVLLIFGIAFYLLWVEMQSTLVSALICFVIVASFGPLISHRLVLDQTRWSSATDRRVRLLTSVLRCWKAIKCSNYEGSIYERYNTIRTEELKEQMSYRLRIATRGSVDTTLWTLLRAAVLATYAFYAQYNSTATFDYVSVFVIYSIVEACQWPLWDLQLAMVDLFTSVSSLQRLQVFLCEAEYNLDADLSLKSTPEKPLAQLSIKFRNATIGYSNKSIRILEDLTASFPAGRLTMIVGSVASGKSTLCAAILGEADVLCGSLSRLEDRYAFCSQDPFLVDGTIEDNILFESAMDRPYYQLCIRAVALEQDIQSLALQDRHPAKQLSGGQKARLALCRALYSRADVYVLDDPLSALDKETERHVFAALFGSDGLLRHKTVILTTNDVNQFSAANHIIRLSGSEKASEKNQRALAEEVESPAYSSALPMPHTDEKLPAQNELLGSMQEDEKDDQERSSEGHVTWRAVWHHCSAAGIGFTSIGLLMNFTFWAFDSIGWGLYLNTWSRQSESDRQANFALYTSVWVVISLVSALAVTSWWFFFKAFHPIKAVQQMHDGQIKGLLRSTASTTDHFSLGFLTNRFSSDLLSYETDYTQAFCVFLGTLAGLIAQLIVILIATPYALIIFAATILFGLLGSRIYLRTSTQLRALQQASKTPLYAAIAATSDLNGLRTIRAFKRQTSFIKKTDESIRLATLPFYALQAARNWLNVILGVFAALLTTCIVVVAVSRRTQSNSLLALALIQAVSLPSVLTGMFRFLTELEVHAAAIERIQMISNLPAEEPQFDPLAIKHTNDKHTTERSKSGVVIFDRVNLRYSSESALALNQVSFRAIPGLKIGICGRSGSGKSTLVAALFRLVDIESGTIQVNGQDVTEGSRYELRDSMTIIPQDPLLIELTIRENLDPEKLYTDAQIWEALDKASARKIVEQLPSKLDHNVKCDGGSISRGQRQLLALSRALLRKRRILVLDEASSSLDHESDQAIQHALRTEFPDTTCLIIAHRISTIVDLDHILVMDSGAIVEEGSPQELLKRNGRFASLAREDHGDAEARKINVEG